MCEEWTPDAIRELLARSDKAVERAVVVIYERQTADEQDAEETKHRNGVGFASCHAHRGSYYARWIQSGRRLDGKHLEKARRMMRWYAGQLSEIAAQRSLTHEREVAHV
jgi:hypothetical protein